MKRILFTKHILLMGGWVALTAAPAMAADMVVKAPLKPVPPAFTWAGFYIGGNIGGKWANTSGTVDETSITIVGAGTFPAASFPIGATSSTFLGGGQAGYNWQMGSLVLGIEGDIDAQDWSQRTGVAANFPPGTLNFVPGDFFTMESRWQASLRGRLGHAWDRFLLYATGGVAWTNVTVGTNFTAVAGTVATTASDSTTLSGATVGGGLEYAFSNKVSLGLEGRYTWYGSHTYNGGLLNVVGNVFTPVSQTITLTTAEVLGKVNVRF